MKFKSCTRSQKWDPKLILHVGIFLPEKSVTFFQYFKVLNQTDFCKLHFILLSKVSICIITWCIDPGKYL